MGKKEAVIEQYLVIQIKKLGGECYKFKSPLRKGVPDRLCILPYGILFFVECKTDKGVVSKLQTIAFNKLTELGQKVVIVSSKAQVDTLINSLLEVIANVIQKDSDAKRAARDDNETKLSKTKS